MSNPELDRSDPAGQAYDWYQRAMELLNSGDAHAALLLIDRLLAIEPHSQSAVEAYARALFDTKQFGASAMAFDLLIQLAPDNDYAHFGKGLALWRTQMFVPARDELAMASVMQPDRPEYARALVQVKATLAAREAGGLPLNGPLEQQSQLDAPLSEES
ncbi:MAG: hypothetical protein Q7L55_01960 [Actinomycetota bacterium]|nr:hypothetical protein [Actinomycetota bacterium]